jgi:hypothetical protein
MRKYFGKIESNGKSEFHPIETPLASNAFNMLWDIGKGFEGGIIVYLTVYDTDPRIDPKAKVWYKARVYTTLHLLSTTH